MQAKVRRLRLASSRWVVLSVAVVIAAVGGVRVVPWAAATTSSGDRAIFEPLPPVRILDTRTTSNPVGPGESRVLQVTGAGGVPADATAVVLNVTAVGPTAAGWLTLYPADATSVPSVSNVNFSAGQVVPNSVTVRLSDTGAVKIFNAAGQTHVIVDVAGYYRGHTHDDRYYVKAQTQARLAANSLTCPAGQFLATVAADGTPTCGVGAQGPQGPSGIVTTASFGGFIYPFSPSPTFEFIFLGPTATVTTSAAQRLTATASGVIGSTYNGDPVFSLAVCFQSVGGGNLSVLSGMDYLTFNLRTNSRQVVSSSASGVPGAGDWRVGLCGRLATGGANLDLTDRVTGWVQVTN